MRKQSISSIRESAFSLVEVTIAIAIAAVAMISLIGMIPTATKSSSDSADQTAIGTMFEDIEDRIKGHFLKPGPLPGSPFFYDLRGSFVDPDALDGRASSIVTERFYRADVRLVEPSPTTAGSDNLEEALAVQVRIFWPINEEGIPLRPDEPGSEITFLTGAQTGPGWTEVDPNYQTKIEY